LNLAAGVRAKNSTAFEAAAQFLQQGLDLLPPDAWTAHYELTLSLHTEGCAAGYLVGQHEDAEQRFKAVLTHAQTSLEKVRVYEAKMAFLEISLKYQEALRLGREGLQALGFAIPAKGTQILVLKEVLLTKTLLRKRTVQDLIDLPALTDPRQLAIVRLLNACVASSFIGDPDYFPIVALRLLRLSVQHGNSMYAAPSYVAYGHMCVGALGDRAGGYQFGRLALEVLEKFDARSLKALVYLAFGSVINHWQRPLKESLDYLLEAYHSGVGTGDFVNAGYALFHYIPILFSTGATLATAKTVCAKYQDEIKRLRQLNRTDELCEMYYQLLLCLSGEAENMSLIKGELFDETIMIPKWREDDFLPGLHAYIGTKLMLHYLSSAFEDAIAVVQEGGQAYLDSLMGSMGAVYYEFYYALTLLAHCSAVDGRTRRQYLRQARSSHKKLKQWAQDAPENFEHMSLLVKAEKSRVQGKRLEETIPLYEQAIELARQHGFTQYEALANELAAKFWLAQGNEKQLASVYLRDAHYAYQLWGAVPKVQDLEAQYGHLLASATVSQATSRGTTTTTTTTTTSSSTGASTSLDVTTIVKASQALSQKVRLDQLLGQIMRIVIENAGATKGVLVINEDGKLWVQAKGTTIQEQIETMQALPVEESDDLPLSVVNYVARTQTPVVLHEARTDSTYAQDRYIQANQPQSLL
ncbi:MAG: hypothetical protein GY832_29955, partial [Chloroflexi bacterium]|nr:hypothetical protein [Chloroflexota bacterium]